MSHREEILARLIAIAVHQGDEAEAARLRSKARGPLPRMKFSPETGYTNILRSDSGF